MPQRASRGASAARDGPPGRHSGIDHACREGNHRRLRFIWCGMKDFAMGLVTDAQSHNNRKWPASSCCTRSLSPTSVTCCAAVAQPPDFCCVKNTRGQSRRTRRSTLPRQADATPRGWLCRTLASKQLGFHARRQKRWNAGAGARPGINPPRRLNPCRTLPAPCRLRRLSLSAESLPRHICRRKPSRRPCRARAPATGRRDRRARR